MKVLFTTNIPAPYRIEFFNELGKYVDLTVLIERGDAKTRNAEWLNFHANTFKYHFLNGIKFGDDLTFDIGALNYLRKNKFDIVIIGIDYSPSALLIIHYLHLHKVPIVFSFDGGYQRKEGKFKTCIKKYIYSMGCGYLSPSEACDYILHKYSILKQDIYRYPFSSLQEEDILEEPVKDAEKKEIKKRLNIPERFFILGVGRLLSWKKWDIVIDCLQSLPEDCGFYLVGGNPQGTVYESLYNRRTPSCRYHFVEFKNKNELTDYYKAANLLVLPSHGEIWGLVVNEAMAKGLPVVSSDTCGSGIELIENNRNGYIFETDNEYSLLECIQKVYKNKNVNFEVNNLNKIKGYTIKKMANVCYVNIANIYTKNTGYNASDRSSPDSFSSQL